MTDKSIFDVDETEDLSEDEITERFSHVRKIVAFDFADELYGVDIDQVSSILLLLPIMPLPRAPGFVLGLVNLRGSLLPLIDLRIKFGLGVNVLTESSRIVVLESEDLRVGMIVDRVWTLLRLPQDVFQPAPPGVAKIDTEYFKEVCSVDNRLLIILNINKLLTETAAA